MLNEVKCKHFNKVNNRGQHVLILWSEVSVCYYACCSEHFFIILACSSVVVSKCVQVLFCNFRPISGSFVDIFLPPSHPSHSPLLTQCDGCMPKGRCIEANGWVAGIVSHGSGILCRGLLGWSQLRPWGIPGTHLP